MVTTPGAFPGISRRRFVGAEATAWHVPENTCAHRGHSTFAGLFKGSMSRGLTFDITEWRQGSLGIEQQMASSSQIYPFVIFFHSPYHSYDKHSAPMQETLVDVTQVAHELLRNPLDLVGRQALMAFINSRPVHQSLFLLSDVLVAAVTSADPWPSRVPSHAVTRPGADRVKGRGGSSPSDSSAAT